MWIEPECISWIRSATQLQALPSTADNDRLFVMGIYRFVLFLTLDVLGAPSPPLLSHVKLCGYKGPRLVETTRSRNCAWCSPVGLSPSTIKIHAWLPTTLLFDFVYPQKLLFYHILTRCRCLKYQKSVDIANSLSGRGVASTASHKHECGREFFP